MYIFFKIATIAVLFFTAFSTFYIVMNDKEKDVRIIGLIMLFGAVGAIYYICN